MKWFLVLICTLLPELLRAQEDSENESLLDAPVGYTTKKLERILKLRGKAHRWEHIVRGFRKEHHFSLNSGISRGKWKLLRYDELINEEFTSSAVEFRFRYSFHLQLYRGFGYFLGSGIGSKSERDVEEKIEAPSVIQLPGILAGITWNMSPVSRVRTGLELYLERWDDLGVETGSRSKLDKISVTTRASSFFAALDLFYNLYWGLSLEYAERRNMFIKPTKSVGQKVDVNIEKTEQVFSMNFIYHLM